MSDRPRDHQTVTAPSSQPSPGEERVDVAILGAGVAGLTLAALLRRQRPEWSVLLLEADDRAGGAVHSFRDDGFVTDAGPVGVLPDPEGALPLARDLGIEPVPAAAAAKRRYLFANHGLRTLPTSPPAFLMSELLHPAAKVRAALEPFVPALSGGEETVHDFLARRLGHGVARAFGEAAVLGVTGGDPKRLSLDAAFPQLRAMEREHGSLIRAALQAAREAKRARQRARETGEPPTPKGLHGFGAEGMQAFVDALVRAVGPTLRTGATVSAVARRPEGTQVHLADGRTVTAARVAAALPPHALAPLMEPTDPVLAQGLRSARTVPMRVMGLGYHRVDVPHPLDGFGFLAPHSRGVRALGVLFSSSLFPGQAPAEHVHLRVLLGGERDPGIVAVSDEEALRVVRRDLQVSLGVDAEPVMVRQLSWQRAIPQFDLGHAARVAEWRARAERAGVALLGSAYGSLGVNGAVREARNLVNAWI